MEFLSQNLVYIVIVAFLLIFLALVFIPILQVKYSGIAKSEQRFNAENEARKTIAQIIGGGAIVCEIRFLQY